MIRPWIIKRVLQRRGFTNVVVGNTDNNSTYVVSFHDGRRSWWYQSTKSYAHALLSSVKDSEFKW